MGTCGDAQRGVAKLRAELEEALPTDLSANLREELVLLFLHVMADVLHHHGDLGVELLVGGVEIFELVQQPLHHMVLLKRFEHIGLRVVNLRSHRGIEDELLDLGMARELLDRVADGLCGRATARCTAPFAGAASPASYGLRGLRAAFVVRPAAFDAMQSEAPGAGNP